MTAQAARLAEPVAPVLDVSRGAWRARDAATQLAEALGVPLPDPETLYDGQDPETIGRGVDAEARGPLPVLVGYRDARALLGHLPDGVRLTVIHDADAPPEDENFWFLQYLERFGVPLDPVPLPRGPVAAQNLTTVQRALLALFPGPLPVDLAALAGLDPSGGDFLSPGIIAPERRVSGAPVSALLRFESRDPRLRLMVQMSGPAHYADPVWLTDTGMALFRAGAQGLALRVLDRACDVAGDPGARAGAELARAGIRIFAHRHAEVAALPDPAPDLPEPVRAQLSMLKAWAEMFGPDPAQGLARIAPAFDRAWQADPPDTDALFLLNIAALGQLRSGDAAAALATEVRIEQALAQAAQIDHRAEFINAINLSRLYRRRGEAAGFRAQVDRAMATSEGLRSAADILQMNLIRALPGGSDTPAPHHLLRAALAWLVLTPPESIAIRALRQLCPGAEPGPQVSATVSAALVARLGEAFPDLSPLPGRVRVTPITGRAPEGSIGLATPGAALLLLPPGYDPGPALPLDDGQRQVAALVRAVLAREGVALPEDAHLGVDMMGRDIPAGIAGLHALVLRHDLSLGRDGRGARDWTAADRLTLATRARVRLAQGVARIEPGEAVFKRYLRPQPLTPEESRLLATLAHGPQPLSFLPPGALSALIERHLITLEVPDA